MLVKNSIYPRIVAAEPDCGEMAITSGFAAASETNAIIYLLDQLQGYNVKIQLSQACDLVCGSLFVLYLRFYYSKSLLHHFQI